MCNFYVVLITRKYSEQFVVKYWHLNRTFFECIIRRTFCLYKIRQMIFVDGILNVICGRKWKTSRQTQILLQKCRMGMLEAKVTSE